MTVSDRVLVAACLALFVTGSARADDEQPAGQAGFWDRARLVGDLGGLRTRLEDAGYKFGLQEQSEVIGVVRGGLRRGAIYDGLSQASLTVDLDKVFGLSGGTFYISAEQLHGRGASQNLVGNLLTVSGIEATRATRLYDLYYEQTLLDGAVSVRIGQMGADEEFVVSQYGALFINSTFGWPVLNTLALPSNGPAFPLTTPGVRVKVKPNDTLTFAGAVFNGNPAGVGPGNPQDRDPSNTDFRTNGGVFAIAEVAYALNPGENANLAGTYRLGGWYNTNDNDDLRIDTAGLSLADPASTGIARKRRGDFAIYAVADQQVWRKPGTKDQGISVFARVAGGPGDRNLSNFYADGGVSWRGAIPGRDSDVAGIGVSYLHISRSAQLLDREVRAFSGFPYPVRDRELVVEATYSYQATGWMMVQPDLQYVSHPGGNVPDPLNPTRRLRGALVLGTRATITF